VLSLMPENWNPQGNQPPSTPLGSGNIYNPVTQ
jgi:hypothetical protein